MRYRKFGKLGWKISALGFGCARLPRQAGEHKDVDEAEAVRMIRYAIDQGVNYLDTAYNYHDGNSERVLGLALRDGYRERVKLADKLPWWLVDSIADPDRLLNQQLERLQTDHGYRAIPCTQCRYCMPCPNGVDIPRNFHEYNYGVIYGDTGFPRFRYKQMMAVQSGAAACIQCRECEPKCTQQIEISAWMPVVHAVLGKEKPYEAVPTPVATRP